MLDILYATLFYFYSDKLQDSINSFTNKLKNSVDPDQLAPLKQPDLI